MKYEKTKARLDVEKALRENSSLTRPLKAERVAELAGIDLPLARHYIGRLVNVGTIANVGKRASSAYYWTAAKPQEARQSVPRFSDTPYTGPRWNIRDGGDAHLAHMSRRGDEFVPHSAPLLMGASLG